MSWNKNTVVSCDLETRVKMLEELGVSFKLMEIGEVAGNGLNDDHTCYYENNFRIVVTKNHAEDYRADTINYRLYRLEYNGKVILERMERHPDCDMDDLIVTFEFTVESEPKEWELERTIHDYDYCSCDDSELCHENDCGYFKENK